MPALRNEDELLFDFQATLSACGAMQQGMREAGAETQRVTLLSTGCAKRTFNGTFTLALLLRPTVSVGSHIEECLLRSRIGLIFFLTRAGSLSSILGLLGVGLPW